MLSWPIPWFISCYGVWIKVSTKTSVQLELAKAHPNWRTLSYFSHFSLIRAHNCAPFFFCWVPYSSRNILSNFENFSQPAQPIHRGSSLKLVQIGALWPVLVISPSELGFLSAGSLGSLSTSPFPSYSGLLRPVIIGVSCFSLSHVATFSIPIVFTIFFCTPSSFVLSLFIFFYPRRSSFCFLNGVSFSIYNLSFGIVYLYVSRVIRLTWFSDIWHCALRGLVLSFGYLGLISHRFIHLLPLAFIMVRVVKPPWGHEISCSLRHISFGKAPSLVEVWDVDRLPFLEDIKKSHNAFSIQCPCLYSTNRDRWCR